MPDVYDLYNAYVYVNGRYVVLGGSGTNNYIQLINKPKINNVELINNKTGDDLGLVNADDVFTNQQVSDLISLL